MSKLPPYEVVRSRRRSLMMQMKPDATLIIKAPLFTPKFLVEQFIRSNEDWIVKRLQKLQQFPQVVKKQYKQGETFSFLGKTHILEIGDYKSITVTGEKMYFPKFLLFRVEKELREWYIRQAKEIITQQVEYYASQMKTSYKALTFSDTTSQWGSCSRDNRLQFCWRLVMAPLLTINYVIVHELAHTKEKNHSRDFWAIVRHFSPSHKQQREWLKTHGHTLVL